MSVTHPDFLQYFVSVPDAQLLFTADFQRAGPDLVLTGHAGRHHIVSGYFASENRLALVGPNGASLSPDLVDLLAGSVAPGEYAHVQPTAPPKAIGKVEKVIGDVTVMRSGVVVALHVGDAVYKSDVVQTGNGSSVSIGLSDGTALNLVATTRMALNEYSYDPNGTSNVALISLVEGRFFVVPGKVAHTGDMDIGTPVATMSIHGGAVWVQEEVATISANSGQGIYSFAVGGNFGTDTHGQYDLIDQSGDVITTLLQTKLIAFVTPQGPGLPPNVSMVPIGSSTPPPDDLHSQLMPQLIHDNGAAPVTINIPVTGPSDLTTVTGALTITVTPPLAPTVTTPTISGTAQEGQTLTAAAAPGRATTP